MTLPRSLLLLVAAIVCFVIALLVALGAISGNEAAWETGGFVSFAGSFLP